MQQTVRPKLAKRTIGSCKGCDKGGIVLRKIRFEGETHYVCKDCLHKVGANNLYGRMVKEVDTKHL